jgi:hypothetical protein
MQDKKEKQSVDRDHPDYVAFENLMRGPYFRYPDLKKVLKSEGFKRFAALFPQGKSGPSTEDVARLEQRQQPHERDH